MSNNPFVNPFISLLGDDSGNNQSSVSPVNYGFGSHLNSPPSYEESFNQYPQAQQTVNNLHNTQPPPYRPQSVSPNNIDRFNWCDNSAVVSNMNVDDGSSLMNYNNFTSPSHNPQFNTFSQGSSLYQSQENYNNYFAPTPESVDNHDQMNLMSENSMSPFRTPERTLDTSLELGVNSMNLDIPNLPYENERIMNDSEMMQGTQLQQMQNFNEDNQFVYKQESDFSTQYQNLPDFNYNCDIEHESKLEDLGDIDFSKIELFNPSQPTAELKHYINDDQASSNKENYIQIPNDPRIWSSDELEKWLTFSISTKKLPDTLNVLALPTTGREICNLSIRELQMRVGNREGILLGEFLNELLFKQKTALPKDDAYAVYAQMCKRLAVPGTQQISLWQFLLGLLSDKSSEGIIYWADSNGEFQIKQPDELAKQWGLRKNKAAMNYDKLSRAIRYYYDKKLLTKVAGKKYAYQVHFSYLEAEWLKKNQDPKCAGV